MQAALRTENAGEVVAEHTILFQGDSLEEFRQQ